MALTPEGLTFVFNSTSKASVLTSVSKNSKIIGIEVTRLLPAETLLNRIAHKQYDSYCEAENVRKYINTSYKQKYPHSKTDYKIHTFTYTQRTEMHSRARNR